MKFIPTNVTRTVKRAVLEAKIVSPKVLFAVGVVGSVASTVLACRATLKLEEKLEHFQADIDTAKQVADLPKRSFALVYAHGTMDIVKLYGPSILVGGLSIVALTTSHVTLERRNNNLSAAYAAVAASYSAYRDRVRTEYGVDKELDIYHGARYESSTIDGKKIVERVVDPYAVSCYAKFFDESSTQWVRHPDYNRMFIQSQQNYWNHKLHVDRFVFLNDVYESLGLPRTEAGQIVGWVLSDDEEGDNYIDFGLYEARSSEFMRGTEPSILLDFNVDGDIMYILRDKK